MVGEADFNLSAHSLLGYFLTAMYAILAIVSIIQIGRIVYFRHSIRSFQCTFLVLVLIWTTLRTLFFTAGTWRENVLLALYWIPICFQFATFSLLAIFCMRQTFHLTRDKETWNSRKKYIIIFWIVLNLVFVIVEVGSIFEFCTTGCVVEPATILEFNHLSMSVAYIILVIAFSYYSLLLWITIRQLKNQTSELSASGVAALSISMVIVLSSRCVYNFLTIYKLFVLSITAQDGESALSGWVAFLFMVGWDIFPTTFLVLYFRTIPSTRFGSSYESFCARFCNNDEEVESTDIVSPLTSNIETERKFEENFDGESDSVVKNVPSGSHVTNLAGNIINNNSSIISSHPHHNHHKGVVLKFTDDDSLSQSLCYENSIHASPLLRPVSHSYSSNNNLSLLAAQNRTYSRSNAGKVNLCSSYEDTSALVEQEDFEKVAGCSYERRHSIKGVSMYTSDDEN